MVASTEPLKSKPTTGNKVSKPLMEKKRRARINQCLDQLKTLLETFYSTSIRKRKLEKADILELTVKHLRNLQKIHKCTDFHRGFRSCLSNVQQYLLMAEDLTGSDRWALAQFSGNLSFSTVDSGPGTAHAQEAEARGLLPQTQTKTPASEDVKTVTCKNHGADTSEGKARYGSKHTQKNSRVKFHNRNEAVNTPSRVWRPW